MSEVPRRSIPLPRLITAAELAASLGLSVARIYELVREQGLPAVRLGRSLRFDPEAVSEWLRSGGTREREPVGAAPEPSTTSHPGVER